MLKIIKIILLSAVILLCANGYIIAQFTTYSDLLISDTCGTKSITMGAWDKAAYWSILKLKSDSSYFIKIFYTEGNNSNMEVDTTNPLIFVFNDTVALKIYPIARSILEFIKVGPGIQAITVLFRITREQLFFLFNNVPEEIKLYYTEYSGRSRFSDNNGSYLNMMPFEWHYKRRLKKIIRIALYEDCPG